MTAVTSPIAGTRTEPKDSYTFVRGTTANFKITFTSNGKPVSPDTGTDPVAKILEPRFISGGATPIPNVITTLTGSLVSGQTYEYEFTWDIPTSQLALDEYIISYEAVLGGTQMTFGDEFFQITSFGGQIGLKDNFYATVTDVRNHKFNIDSFLPKEYAKDLVKRNQLIEEHLRNATTRLREELNLSKSRGNSENYKLFTIYYTIWSILLASRGEDGSAVSDQNLIFYRTEWQRVLDQEKREGVLQGISLGRG